MSHYLGNGLQTIDVDIPEYEQLSEEEFVQEYRKFLSARKEGELKSREKWIVSHPGPGKAERLMVAALLESKEKN